jgi:glycerol-3-phosphate dehydrogenase
MNRESSLRLLDQEPDALWDIVVIGGGATGLGVAMDAAVRGYKVLLLEQSDFLKGTSSRSTKLVHGGVRYLAQGDIRLVWEALKERGLLLKNAPHLADNQSFVIPAYSWWTGIFYMTGLMLYDLLAGRLSLGKSRLISAKRVLEAIPTLLSKDLKNGVVYHDGQFDDARLGINVAQTCVENGGHVINYMTVIGLGKDKNGGINEVQAIDEETKKVYRIKAKVVVNATGVFVDKIMGMDDAGTPPMVRPSQGIHLVLDPSFLPTDHALMIPKTSDGRVLFAVPWHDKVVVGTTDTPIEEANLEPRALEEEVTFILDTFGRYVNRQPTREDVLSVFAGLRPLARPQSGSQKTKEISRSHKLMVSASGLVTITGGKWTTFRKMAEETVDKVIEVGKLHTRACTTQRFKIHGHSLATDKNNWLHVYGADANAIRTLMKSNPDLSEKLHDNYPYVKAVVVWAVRYEMARSVEDVLARRLRVLFLDARAAIDMASSVAQVMANELGKDEKWGQDQVEYFEKLANGYLLTPYFRK